jgi:t-SNARE complex subunit (syntaxin)|tara:strand:- start:607 stop:828 length:222 start_codon:yes stop_codon:yes gene_type:complete
MIYFNDMQTPVKEFSEEVKQDKENVKDLKSNRPNIDHLIKRILTERRKESRKTFFIFVFILIIIAGVVAISLK